MDSWRIARRAWDETRPLGGTIAEHYLEARGVEHVASAAALRFHPALSHPNTPGRFPCLGAGVQDAGGQFLGIQRCYLAPDGSSKEASSTGDTVKASELMQVLQDDAFVRSLPGYEAFAAEQRRQAYAGRFSSLKEVMTARGELQRQHDRAALEYDLAADDSAPDFPMSGELEDLNALASITN